MALHPFFAYLLLLLVFIIGEIAFIFLFCRNQRPRLERNQVVKVCSWIALVFGIVNIFIIAYRTEVLIVESENGYSRKVILKRTGMYESIGHQNYYIMNNSDETVYCAKLHYDSWFSTSSSENVLKPVEPGSYVSIYKDLDGVFVIPPRFITVKRGESRTRFYLLNEGQVEDLSIIKSRYPSVLDHLFE